MHYILIDYENVQPADLVGLETEQAFVLVFMGAQQKVGSSLIEAVQALGERGRFIRIAGNGPNALDFHIAYYLGQLALKEPEAFFHIVSKDTGFDPLIQHLKAHKILACRSIDVSEIPILKTAAPKTQAEKISLVIEDLKRRKASKPRAVKTLTSTISSIFQKQLSDQQVDAIITVLQKREVIAINGTRVTYSLPD